MIIKVYFTISFKDDSMMGVNMVQAWVDFASTGEPTPPDSPLPYWSPVTEDDHRYLRLDTDGDMEVTQDYLNRVVYWKSIMEQRPLP